MVPASSSCRIWNRACCPPESLSKTWSPWRSKLVPAQHGHRGAAGLRVLRPEDFDERPADQLRVGVGLGEMTGDDPGPGLPRAVVGDVLAGEQAQEVRLAGAVGAEHRDPLTEVDLQGERFHQPDELEPLGGERPNPGPPALEPHPDVLLARRFGRRADLFELPQPGLRRFVPRRHFVAAGGVLLHVLDQPFELDVFLRPAPLQLFVTGEPLLPCLVVRAEVAAMDPGVTAGRAGLDTHDLFGCPGQQFPVVGNEEHRFAGRVELVLQPSLARHVEVVVRFVEQENLVRAAQQRFQHQPLLFSAAQCPREPPLGLLVRHAQCGGRADVPGRLGLVPAGVGPVAQGLRVLHLRGFVVHGHDQFFGGVHRACRVANPRRSHREQQVTHSSARPAPIR